MKSKILRAMALLITMTVMSCQKEKETQVVIEKTPSSGKQELSDDSYWRSEEKSFGSSGLIQTKQLTNEARDQVESNLKETSLESLNLPSNLNVNAFTIRAKGNVKTKDAIYIAPKLYLYRKSDKAQVKVRRVDNNVLIPLHAILVDGFSKQIPSADGIDTITLPNSYLVDEHALQKALVDRGYSNQKITYGPLDGCPKQFVLTVAGDSFDVTPTYLAKSNQCEMNRPFTLNLVVPADKADYIINEALYYSQVDVQASFQVLVGYLEADTRIQLNRSKIFEKLQASLEGQYPPYAKADIEVNLKRIIRNETMDIFIKGDRTDIVMQLFQAAYDSFVTPFEIKNPDDATKEKCENYGCLSISYSKSEENRNLEISYQQYSTSMTGQLVSSLAKAQQILFPEVAFSSQKADGHEEYVSNLENNSRELLVSVNRGAIIEVNLENARHQLDNTKVSVSRTDGNRCGSYDNTNRCEWHANYSYVTRTYAGISFSEPYVPAGNILGDPNTQMFLEFHKSSGEVVNCSFTQMNAQSNGYQFNIKVQNTQRCLIFTAEDIENNEQVTVRIMNHLRDAKKLQVVESVSPFIYTDFYERIDAMPDVDTSELGGQSPKSIKEVEREIQLKMKVTVHKYDLSE